ncbi:MAG: hypothetical protein HY474_01330 [Candidatus Sungbacteria bacterium]|uniref:Uncharacterized protein n=1 Tax=Candidatus Sungiibacteriota bacterium TaxID=2750080 RepID=A0A933DTT2_9BACT|nr:hypothetical protein [Candidatus Sungbacteria bacterium]
MTQSVLPRRVRWQQVVLFGTRSTRVRGDLKRLTVGPEFFCKNGQNGINGACSGGVEPPHTDVWLVMQMEYQIALMTAALRSTAERLERELREFRSDLNSAVREDAPDALAQQGVVI